MRVELLRGPGGRRLRATFPADAVGATVPAGKLPVLLNGDPADVVGWCTFRRVAGGVEVEGPILADEPAGRRVLALAGAGFKFSCDVLVRADDNAASCVSLKTTARGAAAADVLAGAPAPAAPAVDRSSPEWRRMHAYVEACAARRVTPETERALAAAFARANRGGR